MPLPVSHSVRRLSLSVSVSEGSGLWVAVGLVCVCVCIEANGSPPVWQCFGPGAEVGSLFVS